MFLQTRQKQRDLQEDLHASTQMGAKTILAKAEGNFKTSQNKSNGWNGYYTWPLLGYDGQVPDDVWSKMPADFQKAAGGKQDSSSVRALCKTPEGRAWWKQNGSTFKCKFDLTPGSESIKTMNDYLAEREAKKKG